MYCQAGMGEGSVGRRLGVARVGEGGDQNCGEGLVREDFS